LQKQSNTFAAQLIKNKQVEDEKIVFRSSYSDAAIALSDESTDRRSNQPNQPDHPDRSRTSL
jgi:hypothetical protein